MRVAELWRYPVKSMAGERITETEVGDRGLSGDRRLAAFELGPRSKEKALSARDLASLLKFRASLNPGRAQVSGPGLEDRAWDDQSVGPALSQQCHRELQLRPVPAGAFDDSPILLLHLASAAALAAELGAPVDHRRFRANLYLDGDGIGAHGEPLLLGRTIRCGSVVLEVTRTCPRCSITTRDPDTWANWPQLLRQLVQAHEEVLGVYCRVKVPGRLVEGCSVEIG